MAMAASPNEWRKRRSQKRRRDREDVSGMKPNTAPSDSEDFAEAARHWDLERLYVDLARAKKEANVASLPGLTDVEKLHLRGLLCGYGPRDIAVKLVKDRRGLQSDLSKTLYRYVEALSNKTRNSLRNWREVAEWLKEAGYRRVEGALTIEPGQDWGAAPEDAPFYGRETELQELERWIAGDRCRLVTIFGMAGIGKTALAVALGKRIDDRFDLLVWRSLRHAPPLSELLADLLGALGKPPAQGSSDGEEARLTALLEILRAARCLTILDNWETVLGSGTLAGSYRPGYEGYGRLLERVGSTAHRSCLLLTSWEKPLEVTEREGDRHTVRSLKLRGLQEGAENILEAKGLGDRQCWQDLIQLYRGNPLALNLAAATIRDLFDGRTAEFLIQPTTVFVGDFAPLVEQQFQRLSSLEQEVMYQLAVEEPLSLEDLRSRVDKARSHSQLMDALQSLERRSLVEKIRGGDRTCFTLQPAVVKSVKSCYRPLDPET